MQQTFSDGIPITQESLTDRVLKVEPRREELYNDKDYDYYRQSFDNIMADVIKVLNE